MTVVDVQKVVVNWTNSFLPKRYLGFFLFQTFLSQSIPHPLASFGLVERIDNGRKFTYAICRFSIFLFDAIAGHSSESGEQPLRERVHEVGSHQFRLLVDDSIADRGHKVEEVFDSREVEGEQPFTKALRSCDVREVDFALLVERYLACGMSLFFDELPAPSL